MVKKSISFQVRIWNTLSSRPVRVLLESGFSAINAFTSCPVRVISIYYLCSNLVSVENHSIFLCLLLLSTSITTSSVTCRSMRLGFIIGDASEHVCCCPSTPNHNNLSSFDLIWYFTWTVNLLQLVQYFTFHLCMVRLEKKQFSIEIDIVYMPNISRVLRYIPAVSIFKTTSECQFTDIRNRKLD